jgi:MoxR-like ATPase
MTTPRQAVGDLLTALSDRLVGQDHIVRGLIIALLCDGHLLVEGPPGTGKTRLIKALAQLLGVSFGRVQFTPDLLPSDLTGSEIYTAKRELEFRPGPLFNQLILADEINRAPARVQSALLEAMEERQVTVGGSSMALPRPFLVMATQNTVDQEGTYPLPEAQLDRFFMKLEIDYPSREADFVILRQQQNEELSDSAHSPVLNPNDVEEAQKQIRDVTLSDSVVQYIVDLVHATRFPERYSSELAGWIQAGASTRASLSIQRAARANAWLAGRDYVEPEDVRAVLSPCLMHRVHLSFDARAARVNSERFVKTLLDHVAAH